MSKRSRGCLWTSVRQCSPAPCDRFKHASCAYQGDVYLLGGRENSSLGDFWKYSVVRNEWTELDCSGDEAPEELEEHSMVAFQGMLYVFGGLRDSAYNSTKPPLWVFDTVKECWVCWRGQKDHSQGTVPVNRKGHSAVLLGSSMFMYGGYVDIRGSSQEFWRLDLETCGWSLLSGSRVAPGPGCRHSHSAMTHLDSMYLFGGLQGLHEQRDLWRWSSTTQTWSSIRAPSGPSRLVGHSAVVYRDSMLLYGGGQTQGSPSSCLWRLNLSTYTWEKLPVLPESTPPCRVHHCAIGLGPSFQPREANGIHKQETAASHSINGKLRPFKNKCSPSETSAWPGGDIELQALDGGKGKSLSDICLTLKDAKQKGDCLTFENQEAITWKWNSLDLTEEQEENMALHLPDLLLVIGGKPLGGHHAVSVWQMTLAEP